MPRPGKYCNTLYSFQMLLKGELLILEVQYDKCI
jgi:hypothetical protein